MYNFGLKIEIIAKQNCKPHSFFFARQFYFCFTNLIYHECDKINFVTEALKMVESLLNTHLFIFAQDKKNPNNPKQLFFGTIHNNKI